MPTQLKNTYISSSTQIASSVFPISTNQIILPYLGTQVQGTWTAGYYASSFMNYAVDDFASKALNDELTFTYNLPAGTYDMELWYRKNSTMGIVDVSIDGTVIFDNVDIYAASPTQSNVLVTGIVIPTSGDHTFSLKAVGKNASASAYEILINAIVVRRTA